MAEPTRADVPSNGSRTERVGRFQMAIAYRETPDDAEHPWSRRGLFLARWLLEQWHQEQAAGKGGRRGKR